MIQIGIYSYENSLIKLSKLGDSLEKLDVSVDWEIFRPLLNKVFKQESKGQGGRPPYDYVLRFKCLVMKRLYNLSYDQLEFQINDRNTFKRFLGLGLGSTVPDAKTIHAWESKLAAAKVDEALFKVYNEEIQKMGLIEHKGTMVDATFVEVPKQRNSREENRTIKEGKIPEEWKKPENVNKLRQKDTDARWTKKNDVAYYGYKDNVEADVASKLITNYTVTAASVHDSQALNLLLRERLAECAKLKEAVEQVSKMLVEKSGETEDRQQEFEEYIRALLLTTYPERFERFYADSAYNSAKIKAELPINLIPEICEKGQRNSPLTEEQKASNKAKSHFRSRIEHIFGMMTGTMHGLICRSIGINRVKLNIGLTNLIYNMLRVTILKKQVA